MCISGLARNMNDWKLTGRKKKEVMKTGGHSEHHPWCCHTYPFILQPLVITEQSMDDISCRFQRFHTRSHTAH